jgi:DNA-binding transcriptional LysR family regulator
VTGALSKFRASYPGIDLHFSEYEPEDSLPLLRRGEIDVAVVFDYPAIPVEADRDLERELLLTESMYIALPAGHALADAPTVSIAELSEEPWLCSKRPSSCSEMVMVACREAGFDPRVEFESDDYSVLQGFVAGGLGVTLLPDLALASLRNDVVVRPIVPDAPQRRVWATIRAEGSRSPAADAMVEVLKAEGERLAGEAASAAGATRPARRRAATRHAKAA